MARRKKKRGGMSQPRKWAKKLLGFVRLGVGVGGYGAMTLQGVSENLGNPGNIPAGIVYRNTGVDITSGAFDMEQAKRSILAIVATTAAVALLSYGIKRV